MAIEVFKRFELKYMITMEQYERFLWAILPYMRFDDYGNNEGKYNIVSLYFENNDYQIYYETKNKKRFRQKLRLRIYDEADLTSHAFFEIKKKYKNVVNKRRTVIPLREAYNIIENPEFILSDYHPSNPQILQEVIHFKSLYELAPQVIVSYDRQALSGLYENDLRITFDYNLMCRKHDLRVENGPQGIHFVKKDHVVLEVKVSESVPYWLARLISDSGFSRQSVSKYCTSIELTTDQYNRMVQ